MKQLISQGEDALKLIHQDCGISQDKASSRRGPEVAHAYHVFSVAEASQQQQLHSHYSFSWTARVHQALSPFAISMLVPIRVCLRGRRAGLLVRFRCDSGSRLKKTLGIP